MLARLLLGSFLDRFLGFLPTDDANAHVLDIGITEFLCCDRSLFPSTSCRALAVGDDERVLIFGQCLGEAVPLLEINKGDGPGEMPGLVGVPAIDIDDRQLPFLHGLFHLGDGHVSKGFLFFLSGRSILSVGHLQRRENRKRHHS